MRYGVRFLILGCFVLAAVSSQAFAEEHMAKDCPKKDMHGMMQQGMKQDETFFQKAMFIKSKAAELGLSDEQQDKIMTLKLNTKKAGIKYDADVETLALDIKSELMKDSIDLKTVNSLIDKKYAVKAQKAKDLVAACADLQNILTKEQKDKLKTMCPAGGMMEKSKEHMGMHKKMMMKE